MINNKDIEIYIDNKYDDLIGTEKLGSLSKYLEFYRDIEYEELKYLFSFFHSSLNNSFKFLNSKLYNRHYNAEESRVLIALIDNIEQVLNALLQYKISYRLDKYYLKIIDQCKNFLLSSGGSSIPEDFVKIDIIEIKPIFQTTSLVKIRQYSFKTKLIGEGSYSSVLKYKDEYYNIFFAIKKAKSSLDDKEIKRFILEYETMKKLNSPYILKVYNFDEKEMSYTMEYIDFTLHKYINENNTKLSIQQRTNIIKQIFKAFEYINSEVGYHRDISVNNILIKIYDDTFVVKVSDFGLVKLKENNLTSVNTEYKGSLNDPKLDIVGGFKSYTIYHETYALTRLIYFIMTGKMRIDDFANNKNFENFINKGLSDDTSLRYQSVQQMRETFNRILF